MMNTLTVSGASRRTGCIVLWTFACLFMVSFTFARAASPDDPAAASLTAAEQILSADIAELGDDELARANRELLQELVRTRRELQARRSKVETDTEEGRKLAAEMNDLRRQLEARERALQALMAKDESMIELGADEKILAGALRRIAGEMQKRAADSSAPPKH
jgi:predicted phage-related endonuclease